VDGAVLEIHLSTTIRSTPFPAMVSEHSRRKSLETDRPERADSDGSDISLERDKAEERG